MSDRRPTSYEQMKDDANRVAHAGLSLIGYVVAFCALVWVIKLAWTVITHIF